MIDKAAYNSRLYTDLQGLEQLRYQSNQNTAVVKNEAAKQFESILMEIVMRSMRDANKVFSDDLFGGDQMDMYQDMLDKQLSMITTTSPNSFAAMVEKNIDQHFPQQKAASENTHQSITKPLPKAATIKSEIAITKPAPHPALETATISQPLPQPQKTSFSNAEDFVTKLWGIAKDTAKLIGVDPKILIAQAALETNWGQKVIADKLNQTTHNLFNIKADASWTKKVAHTRSLEQKNGILAKEKSSFRSYGSFLESFHDYVSFLKGNSRYSEALKTAAHPDRFVHELQAAGYATDSHYADKILQIVSSKTFNTIINKLK